MLEYAAGRRAVASRQSSPHALLVVISIHVALAAAVMSAKMDLPTRIFDPPIKVILVPDPPETPVDPTTPKPQPIPSGLTTQKPIVETPTVKADPTDLTPALPEPGGLTGDGTYPLPIPEPFPLPLKPVHRDARLLTPPSALKPPYPESKLLSGEEAVLTLHLTVDPRGRVIAVDPVGRADRTFLDSARRYLIAHWRYEPATDDGRAVASSFTITLRFQLDG